MVCESPDPIYLLLTEVVMPDMNGRELSQAVQVIRPEIRCVFMSGYTANLPGRPEGGRAGSSPPRKPFSLQELARTLRNVQGRA